MDTFVADKENSMEIPRWLHDALFNNRYRIIKHILFWLFIYADELLSWMGVTEVVGTPIMVLLTIILDMVMVYFNIYVLLPRLFLKSRVLLYCLYTAISIVIVVCINYFIWMDPYLLFFDSEILGVEIEDLEPLTINDFYTYLLGNLWSNAGIVAMAVAFKLFQVSYSTSLKLQDLKEDQLNTELAYLKTQVNPHFLFNTLNNMYVMSKKKSEHLPDTIMQLSDLLRYQLYDTEANTVPLNNEITYLKNYLELEQLRRQHLELIFDISGNTGAQKIRPLILLPYIENAFKYSNSGTGSDYIKIQLQAGEKKVNFSVENTKGTLHRRAVGGIGMANAQRRLELGYPNKHTLDIQETEKTFLVTLTLDTQ